jgi:hypothetical protein
MSLPSYKDCTLSEDELAELLRAEPERERLDWLLQAAAIDPEFALRLARRSIGAAEDVRRFASEVFGLVDASEMRWWVEFARDRLGIRRTRRFVDEAAALDPVRARQARYWLQGK